VAWHRLFVFILGHRFLLHDTSDRRVNDGPFRTFPGFPQRKDRFRTFVEHDDICAEPTQFRHFAFVEPLTI